MTDEKTQTQEFKLDPDCELRFEVETKNEKVTLEVCTKHILFIFYIIFILFALIIHIYNFIFTYIFISILIHHNIYNNYTNFFIVKKWISRSFWYRISKRKKI